MKIEKIENSNTVRISNPEGLHIETTKTGENNPNAIIEIEVYELGM